MHNHRRSGGGIVAGQTQNGVGRNVGFSRDPVKRPWCSLLVNGFEHGTVAAVGWQLMLEQRWGDIRLIMPYQALAGAVINQIAFTVVGIGPH
ncbi:hypothetical protein D3C81_2093210 [compost metagenome]